MVSLHIKPPKTLKPLHDAITAARAFVIVPFGSSDSQENIRAEIPSHLPVYSAKGATHELLCYVLKSAKALAVRLSCKAIKQNGNKPHGSP